MVFLFLALISVYLLRLSHSLCYTCIFCSLIAGAGADAAVCWCWLAATIHYFVDGNTETEKVKFHLNKMRWWKKHCHRWNLKKKIDSLWLWHCLTFDFYDYIVKSLTGQVRERKRAKGNNFFWKKSIRNVNKLVVNGSFPTLDTNHFDTGKSIAELTFSVNIRITRFPIILLHNLTFLCCTQTLLFCLCFGIDFFSVFFFIACWVSSLSNLKYIWTSIIMIIYYCDSFIRVETTFTFINWPFFGLRANSPDIRFSSNCN